MTLATRGASYCTKITTIVRLLAARFCSDLKMVSGNMPSK